MCHNEYQEYAKEFIISHKVSALFLDCGLGKTVITLTAIWELLFDYFDIRKNIDYWPSPGIKGYMACGIGKMGSLIGSWNVGSPRL